MVTWAFTPGLGQPLLCSGYHAKSLKRAKRISTIPKFLLPVKALPDDLQFRNQDGRFTRIARMSVSPVVPVRLLEPGIDSIATPLATASVEAASDDKRDRNELRLNFLARR